MIYIYIIHRRNDNIISVGNGSLYFFSIGSNTFDS